MQIEVRLYGTGIIWAKAFLHGNNHHEQVSRLLDFHTLKKGRLSHISDSLFGTIIPESNEERRDKTMKDKLYSVIFSSITLGATLLGGWLLLVVLEKIFMIIGA